MKEGHKARIAPGTRRQIGWVNSGIVRLAGIVSGSNSPNVFTTLARHRSLFRRWLWFASALMPFGRLPRDETELVILRVAHNTGCEYEWAHHERIGRRAGLTDAEIAQVRDRDASGWSERRSLLLHAADELHVDRRIGDELWERLGKTFDERELIELCMLAGHYEMLAMTLNSLQVALDPPPDRHSQRSFATLLRTRQRSS